MVFTGENQPSHAARHRSRGDTFDWDDFKAAGRQAIACRFVAVGADLIEEGRVDEPRHQRTDLDTMFGKFDFKRLGQPAHRKFSRRIDGQPGDAVEARR